MVRGGNKDSWTGVPQSRRTSGRRLAGARHGSNVRQLAIISPDCKAGRDVQRRAGSGRLLPGHNALPADGPPQHSQRHAPILPWPGVQQGRTRAALQRGQRRCATDCDFAPCSVDRANQTRGIAPGGLARICPSCGRMLSALLAPFAAHTWGPPWLRAPSTAQPRRQTRFLAASATPAVPTHCQNRRPCSAPSPSTRPRHLGTRPTRQSGQP